MRDAVGRGCGQVEEVETTPPTTPATGAGSAASGNILERRGSDARPAPLLVANPISRYGGLRENGVGVLLV